MRATAPLLASFVLVGTVGLANARRPITPVAPEFPPGLAWVNSTAFHLKDLRGKRVVLITFINTLTAASVRTYPDLNRLWDRYKLEGLMIIGVHSPDYDFDRDPISVRDIILNHDIAFPVIIDSRREIWDAFKNEGWPAQYLIDHTGKIIHDRLGGGGYAELEEEILLALRDFNGYRPPANYQVPPDPALKDCGTATKGFYLGSRRGKTLKQIQPNKYIAVTKARDGEVAVLGKWATDPDAVRAKEGDEDVKFTTRLRIIYQGSESMGVFTRSGDKPARLFIKQNDLWLHSGNGAKDVKWDDDDRSYILIDNPRLYHITKNAKKDMQELVFFPGEPGIGFASFEFSDSCQAAASQKKKEE